MERKVRKTFSKARASLTHAESGSVRASCAGLSLCSLRWLAVCVTGQYRSFGASSSISRMSRARPEEAKLVNHQTATTPHTGLLAALYPTSRRPHL